VSEISYRFAIPSDIETLVRLRLEFLAEGGQGGTDSTGLPAGIRDYFSTKLPNGEFVAALAESDGTVIGGSGMIYDRRPPRSKNPTGLSPYILNMYVAPEFRRQGIATQLLQMLINHAKAAGSKVITLHFWPGKSALYAKVGFVPSEREMKIEF